MPFSIRPNHRFSVCGPLTYQCGDFEGHGTVRNLSLKGWRVSGNLPLRIGEVCSLTVNLPTQETLYVAAGVVRWVRGEEYGVETVVMDDESREDMGDVFLLDGIHVNHELVKAGWCWWYRKYAPGDMVLDVLEKAAREAKKGLWTDLRPVPPWEWRKRSR